jgi:heptosyltransferase-3
MKERPLIMHTNDDILSLLREEGAQAARKAQRGVIVQPGAIGDCILTLPLAAFMKETLGLGGIDLLGHTEYIGILPGRTCVDSVSSIDSIELHRLFVEPKAFDLADRDPLINAFAGYAWIATFLGEPGSHFEQNLVFTANCSHSSEVVTLAMKPPAHCREHLAMFYKEQFIHQSGLSLKIDRGGLEEAWVKATDADLKSGKELLEEAGLDPAGRLLVIQPGSGGTNKCWHLDNFLAVAQELDSQGINVAFLLGPAELERFDDSTLKRIGAAAAFLTDLSLTQVVGLLSCVSGFVGNDSGITHLAAGLGVQTFVIFGPTNAEVYRPVGPAVTVFTNTSKTFASKPSRRLQGRLLEAVLDYC